jgi:hypothetical protein
MNIEAPEIVKLKAQVEAASQEFGMAIAFHEAWKPAAYDEELHKRMGVSYATNTFKVVRAALRREMLLALMRLWDNDKKAVGMVAIATTIDESVVIRALAADRAARFSLPGVEDQMRQELSRIAGEAKTLIDQYSAGGSHENLFKKLRTLRDKHLVHREVTAPPATEATDKEIEAFYQDNAKLISLLLHLVMATAYDPEDAAGVHRHHAGFFLGGRLRGADGRPSRIQSAPLRSRRREVGSTRLRTRRYPLSPIRPSELKADYRVGKWGVGTVLPFRAATGLSCRAAKLAALPTNRQDVAMQQQSTAPNIDSGKVFKAFQAPYHWYGSAKRLHSAAEVILAAELPHEIPYLRAYEAASKEALISPDATAEVKHTPPNFLPAQLLFAFALENVFKGLILARNPGLMDENRLSRVISSHDLVDLAQKAQIRIAQLEIQVLEALSELAEWAGRYPLPLRNEADFITKGNPNVLMDYGSLHPTMRHIFSIALRELEGLIPANQPEFEIVIAI